MNKVISNLFKKYRGIKANRKWKKDFEWIKREAKKTERNWYWFQLVYQEIKMWILIGEKVSIDEFCFICARRGLNLKEQNYLESMLKEIGLWKGIKWTKK